MSQSTTTHTVILESSSDWDEWLYTIRSSAKRAGVWDLINPGLGVEPQSLQKPAKVTPSSIKAGAVTMADLNSLEKEDYRMSQADYRSELNEYTRQDTNLSTIHSLIQSTILQSNVVHIIDANTLY